MTTRSLGKSVTFSHPSELISHPFELKGVDRVPPAGDYRVVTVANDPHELQTARERDLNHDA